MKTISFKLTEDELLMLDNFASSLKISRSDFIRNSLNSQMLFNPMPTITLQQRFCSISKKKKNRKFSAMPKTTPERACAF